MTLARLVTLCCERRHYCPDLDQLDGSMVSKPLILAPAQHSRFRAIANGGFRVLPELNIESAKGRARCPHRAVPNPAGQRFEGLSRKPTGRSGLTVLQENLSFYLRTV